MTDNNLIRESYFISPEYLLTYKNVTPPHQSYSEYRYRVGEPPDIRTDFDERDSLVIPSIGPYFYGSNGIFCEISRAIKLKEVDFNPRSLELGEEAMCPYYRFIRVLSMPSSKELPSELVNLLVNCNGYQDQEGGDIKDLKIFARMKILRHCDYFEWER